MGVSNDDQSNDLSTKPLCAFSLPPPLVHRPLLSTSARKHKDAAKLSLFCRLLHSHSRRTNPSPERCRTIRGGQSDAACSSSSSSKSHFLSVEHEKVGRPPQKKYSPSEECRIPVSTSTETPRSPQRQDFAENQQEKKLAEGFFLIYLQPELISKCEKRSAAAQLLRPLAPCGQSDGCQLPFTLIGIKIFPGQKLQEKFPNFKCEA